MHNDSIRKSGKHVIISDKCSVKPTDVVEYLPYCNINLLYLVDVIGVWIYGYSKDKIIDIIKFIRIADNTWSVPIFIGTCSDMDIDYCDGIAENYEEYLEKCTAYIDSIEQITSDIPTELRSLAFANSRGIEVVKCTPSPYGVLYRYPLLDIFSIHSTHTWINRCVEWGLITPAPQPSGNCRLCPKCFGSTFNFKERCISCESEDIIKTNLIHCFICNNVEHESKMGTGDNMICPACKGELVHRGVDYQYILDVYDCIKCNNKTQNSSVHVWCLSCKNEYKAVQLIKHDFHHYLINSVELEKYFK